MAFRAVSLRAQLLMAFVTVVVGATAGLTFDAYRVNLAKLEVEARKDGVAAASARAQALERMLKNRQTRVRLILTGARALCGEQKPNGAYAFAPDCMKPMLNAFRSAEGAMGAVVMQDDYRVVASGAPVPNVAPRGNALARIVWSGLGEPGYVMHVTNGELTMSVHYGNAEVDAIFSDDSSLGARGEAFLIDRDGRFLTAARYPALERGERAPRTPAGAAVEPIAACAAGTGQTLDIDYRGVMTLHAFQNVPALDDACVDAHVNWDEALQPAADLRDRLLTRGLLFILFGALFSLYASHRIAAPVQRLARAARGMHARLDAPLPLEGPSEVRALALALRDASSELAALVAREQAARREAQSASRAKDRFLAAVSHELRTPLTAILGWTHIIRGQMPSLDPKLERGLAAIERNAAAQRRLVEDLLDVSRIVAGRLRIERQTVVLAGVVERGLDTIRPQAEEKGVAVLTRIENPGLAVAGDPLRLEQVVANLAGNAVKFSRPGGAVLVVVKQVDNTVQLSVRDEGEGIDPAELPRVFDWFWQSEGDTGTSSSGLGLGLGIVRQLVEIHGGTVRAESEGPGLGSRFIVTLPLAPADVIAPSADRAPAVAPIHSSFEVH